MEIDTPAPAIEGTGRTYEVKPRAIRVYTVSDLLPASVDWLHRTLDHEIPVKSVRT